MADIDEPERVTYDVHGSTLAEVAAAMAEMDEAGRAEWWPSYDYQQADGVITSANVRVVQRMTMPRWPEYTAASQASRTEWDRAWHALEAHEEGHFQLVSQHVASLEQQLIGQPVEAAQGIFDHALADLATASEAYDTATDHGRNQGTVIDLDVDPAASGAE
jgi:predicted secreted Zn-dependent protease